MGDADTQADPCRYVLIHHRPKTWTLEWASAPESFGLGLDTHESVRVASGTVLPTNESKPRINLRAERLNLGLNERDFAAACKVSQPTLQRLERPGQHWVKPANVKLVADYLTERGVPCKVVDLLPPHVVQNPSVVRTAA